MTRVAWEATFAALDLAGLGWARAVRSAPADLLTHHPDARPARVVRVDRGRMLLVADGDGALRHVRDRTNRDPDDGDHAVVGDWVLLDPPVLGSDGYPFARVRLPRVGTIARRRDTDSLVPQVLAANVDLVLVAEALDPDRTINEARVARVVALAGSDGADVRVLLTGTDRLDEAMLDELPREVAGVPTIATSIVDGRGFDELRGLLPAGATATIVGASGAGKSSIANALLDDAVFATSERRASGTGRHTTSVARLVPTPTGALLVDTPGIRSVGMHGGVDVDAIAPAAIGELAERCRFRDCHHDGEPGCAVAAAIDAGDLPGDAVATWRKLEREALREQARVDDRLRRELAADRMAVHRAHTRARRRGEIVERRR